MYKEFNLFRSRVYFYLLKGAQHDDQLKKKMEDWGDELLEEIKKDFPTLNKKELYLIAQMTFPKKIKARYQTKEIVSPKREDLYIGIKDISYYHALFNIIKEKYPSLNESKLRILSQILYFELLIPNTKESERSKAKLFFLGCKFFIKYILKMIQFLLLYSWRFTKLEGSSFPLPWIIKNRVDLLLLFSKKCKTVKEEKKLGISDSELLDLGTKLLNMTDLNFNQIK